MFSRTGLGLEINSDGIQMALVGGARTKPVLQAFSGHRFAPETVRVTLRELNVLNPAAFVAAVRDAHLRLLTRTTRTAVALPDAAGRVLLLDLDTRFKSRDEAADIIRWKLKKNFPFDINDAHFDFQQVQQKETGEISVLVSLICRQVLNQYEELIVEAGLQPNQIDFTSFRLHELFSPRLSVDEDYIFISHFAGVLSILLFKGGALDFYRSKEIPSARFSVNRVYREISSSLLVYQDKTPDLSLGKVYCLIDRQHTDEFRSMVAEATNLEPVFLDTERAVLRASGLSHDPGTVYDLTASLGSALRNL